MREFAVSVGGEETHDVIENQNAFDRVSDRLGLRLQPVDHGPGGQGEELVYRFWVLDGIDHEFGNAPQKCGQAERAAGGHHRNGVARIENAGPVHAVEVQR